MRNPFTRHAPAARLLAIPFLFAASFCHAQDTGTGETSASTHAVGHATPAIWSDTFVGARYANDFHFPGSARKVAQKIGFPGTVGGFRYGKYAFTTDYLVSDKNNPKAGTTSGAQEVYGIGRVEWSAGRILGRSIGNGILRDAGFTTGFDFSSKNDGFASSARMLILRPSVEFAVPGGHWNAMLGWRTETNYNGIVHKDVKYDTAAQAESAWLIPLHAGPHPPCSRAS